MGLHGHMDNIVSGVVDAANNSEMLTGIGITPEGICRTTRSFMIYYLKLYGVTMQQKR